MGRRAPVGTSSLAVAPFTIRWSVASPTADAIKITVRNAREGSSHSHRHSPATIVASATRSLKSSIVAPRRETR